MTNVEFQIRQDTAASNTAYITGMYKGMLNVVLDHGYIKDETIVKLIKQTIANAEKIWDNRYDKHYTEILAKEVSSKNSR